jgi:hypothetical protein
MAEIANLESGRYKSSGIYFARFSVRGKLIRRRLETIQLSVAKLRVAGLEKKGANGPRIKPSLPMGCGLG